MVTTLAVSMACLSLVPPAAADRLDDIKARGKLNKALLDVETSGDGAKIFDAWFGPQSQEPMARKFKIQAD